MAFRMPSATTRSGSAVPVFRQRVPRDVAARARGRTLLIDLPACGADPEITVAAAVTDQIKFSLRCREPAAVKARMGAAVAHLSRTWDAIRRGPARLTHKQVVALAGEVYRHLIETCGDDPGRADSWAAVKGWGRAVAEGRVAAPPALAIDPRASNEVALAREVFGHDLTAGIDARIRSGEVGAALESRYGLITSWTLMRRALEVDADTRARLLVAVHGAVTDACLVLKRNAGGDYTPDPRAARFPPFEVAKPAEPSLTMADILDRWRAETLPSLSTLSNWRGVLKRFRAFLGHEDARRIGPDQIVAYKDHLIEGGTVTPRTINTMHLVVLKRLFSYAVENRMIRENPALKVRAADKVRAGEGRLPYTDAEVGRLLTLAAGQEHPVRRWVPLLAALTGARVGEIMQAWGDQITVRNGFPVIEIRPARDGGTLKNAGSERTVPLHPVIVASGFIEWATARGDAPLFYRPGSGNPQRAHPSAAHVIRLAEWVRLQGFNDPRKSPNHALRHWTKSKLHELGVQEATADAIQGHKGKTEASTYRHVQLATMAEAIALLPVPSGDAQAAVRRSQGLAGGDPGDFG